MNMFLKKIVQLNASLVTSSTRNFRFAMNAHDKLSHKDGPNITARTMSPANKIMNKS